MDPNQSKTQPTRTKNKELKMDTILGPFFGVFDIESPWKTFKSVKKLSLNPLLAFDDLIKKYGPVVKIYMGGQNAILLGGKQTLCKQKYHVKGLIEHHLQV